ncbi:MAG: DNA translocase FtsK 4TM domain-containing protein, partial [Bdellovibrionales bacterium]|nr:DNA translocase FtsK 4TM domain-containing protein [Bdellovibrionales bacterium]
MKWYRARKNQKKWDNFKSALIFCLTVFLALSLFSYDPRDPSLNSFGLHLKVFNACGYVGAVLSDLFFQMFGISAWLFVLGGFALSWKFFKKPRSGESAWMTGLFYFLSFTSLCCLLNLYFPNVIFYEGVSLGGALGTVLFKAMIPLFHTLGTTLILCSILIMSFVFSGYSLVEGRLFTLMSRLFKYTSYLGSVMVRGFSFVLNRFPHWLAAFKKKIKSIPWSLRFLKRSHQQVLKSDVENGSSDSGETFKIFEERISSDFSQDTPEDSEEEDLNSNSEEEEDSFEEEAPLSAKTFTADDLPSLSLLSSPPLSSKKINREEAQVLSRKLMDKFNQFAIKGRVTAIKTGPAVTLFEFRPDDNVKISRISEMANDISLALSSESVRIIAPIPGRDVVGIEASNTYRETVYLKTLLG